LAVAGLPAMLYALQGVLQYVSYQNLDPVTFNGLTQTKTLSAAFCCWLIVHQPQSPIQIVALAILLGSALVFQGYIRLGMKTSIPKKAVSTTTTIQQSTAKASIAREDWIWRGVVPCLGAAFLSGLAGALSQKGLQLTGIRGRDPFLYTIEISFYSAVTLLFNIVRSSNNNDNNGTGNVLSNMMDWQKQKAYWNWKTFIPIVVKATGGVITALVHKYAGSVSKGFALMFGLVLSNMIQLTMQQDSQQLQPYQVVGTIMIMLSTWMHFTNPPI
jgi:UDP-sugar transporter A1/2/3